MHENSEPGSNEPLHKIMILLPKTLNRDPQLMESLAQATGFKSSWRLSVIFYEIQVFGCFTYIWYQ